MENLKDSLPKINWHLIVLNSLRERDSIAQQKIFITSPSKIKQN